MSEKRFRITTLPKSNAVAFDEKEKKHYIGTDLEDLLNEQQATIGKLQKENIELKKLRKYCAEWMGVKEENLYDVVR